MPSEKMEKWLQRLPFNCPECGNLQHTEQAAILIRALLEERLLQARFDAACLDTIKGGTDPFLTGISLRTAVEKTSRLLTEIENA